MPLDVGDTLPPLRLSALDGTPLPLPDPQGRLTHLQLRRFSGCPICSLHLHEVADRLGEIEAAGVRTVAVFHSRAEEMLPYQHALPFAVVADPGKALYRRFGVEASPRAFLAPHVWCRMLRGLPLTGLAGPLTGSGGHMGLPGDVLIDRHGQIVAIKRGTHADDQWAVDDVLRLARRAHDTD